MMGKILKKSFFKSFFLKKCNAAALPDLHVGKFNTWYLMPSLNTREIG